MDPRLLVCELLISGKVRYESIILLYWWVGWMMPLCNIPKALFFM